MRADMSVVTWSGANRASGATVIYYAGAFAGDALIAVKIGFTAKNPSDRLASLATSTHLELRLLATEPGDLAHEKKLHRSFAKSHMRREWFEPSNKLLRRISRLSGGKWRPFQKSAETLNMWAIAKSAVNDYFASRGQDGGFI